LGVRALVLRLAYFLRRRDSMLFKKLFQVLVLGGAVVGTSSACSSSAQAQGAATKRGMADAGRTPDAGATAGGGVQGW
jgi:hypothetical protein